MKKKAFVCSYWVGMEKYSKTIYAADWQEAEQIAKANNLILDGELMATVPYQLGWLVKVMVWFRNLLK